MITIRPILPSDYECWSTLYADYALFYQVKQTKEMRDKLWTWPHDANHKVNGLLAVTNGGIAVGLAHYRPFSRPLSASTGGFLYDLFVQPSTRDEGVGKQLINAVIQIGKERKWTVIRWITAENNYRARGSYDKIATQTKWVTYDISL